MMRYYCCVALLILALDASLVQTAPRDDVMTIYRVDQVGLRANNIIYRNYAFDEKLQFVPKFEFQMIPEQLDRNDKSAMRMHFLQLNLLKFLIILDVIILICVFYCAKND